MPTNLQNTAADQMEAAFNKYIEAIKNNKFDDFRATLDPESSEMKGSPEQLQQGFDFLSQGAEPVMFDSIILDSLFVKVEYVGDRFNIPGLNLYISEYPQTAKNPISGEQLNTRVNAVFFRQVDGVWKIRSYSTFNYNKTGDNAAFDSALEKFLKGIYF